jgi:hypothetical protein
VSCYGSFALLPRSKEKMTRWSHKSVYACDHALVERHPPRARDESPRADDPGPGDIDTGTQWNGG